MSFKNINEYLHFDFDDFPVLETGSSEDIVVVGDSPISLVPGKFKNGIQLISDNFYTFPVGSRYESFKFNVTFGFWLYSVSKRSKVLDGSSISASMPVFDISNTSVNGLNFNVNGGMILVYEKCVFDNFNQLQICLVGSDGSTYEFESELFETGRFNNFIIAINMEIDEIKLFINGVETVISSINGAGLPGSLGTNGSFNLNINKNIIGETVEFEKNSGILDDLFIINEYVTENYLIKKIISNGFKKSINDISSSFNEFNFNAKISFNQEIKINPPVTCLDVFNTDIIAGTQDGLLLKGESNFWNKKINLGSTRSLNDIKIFKVAIDSSSSSSNLDGHLIEGKGIRLVKNGIIISD